jgi:type I restriction enzyme S subunit
MGEGVPLINGPVEFSKDSFGKTIRSKFTTQPTKLCKEGDLILCVRGSTTGRMNIAGFDACVGRGVAAIRAKQYQPWINHFISSKRDEIHGKGTGATFPNVSGNTLADFTLVVPPLTEQQRIVGILDEAFDGIATAKANAEKNLQNARALFQAIFSSLTDVSDQRGWRRKTVADVALAEKGSIRTGPFGSQLLHSEFVDEGIAVLGIDNAVNNEFRWAKKRCITPEKFRELARYQVKPWDVLITIMGTCGRCAIVPGDIPTAINTKHVCCITLDTSKCVPGYLHAYFLYHPVARQFLSKRAKGAIMAGLNMEIIRALPVLLPPLNVQASIVKKLETLRDETSGLATIYQRKLAALNELKKSLLDQAFSGAL